MIEKETIDTIKSTVDVVALVKAKGIELKKNGKSYFGLCPFHDDTNPSLSVNPSTNLWQCFGCGAGGDVIRFVDMFDKLSFPEAAKQLESPELKLKSISQRAKPASGQTGLTVKGRRKWKCGVRS